AVSKLNATIRARLDDLMHKRCTIFIGDANGADKAVQTYLDKRHYRNVIVFCIREPRNNVGAWPTRRVEPPNERKDFAYYAAKDLAMSQEAQCGIMLWDARSKGTLQNILNLIGAGKRVLVYFAPSKDFFVIGNEQDLQGLLARCEKHDLDAASRGLGLKTPLSQFPLSLSR
ncbi:MAG TPA: hypothetical protein VJS43_16090, partial [Candidatus Acidoferrales bacterium]|nr:hypothetical protein [Candidatus Acidoferrales bacterium]